MYTYLKASLIIKSSPEQLTGILLEQANRDKFDVLVSQAKEVSKDELKHTAVLNETYQLPPNVPFSSSFKDRTAKMKYYWCQDP